MTRKAWLAAAALAAGVAGTGSGAWAQERYAYVGTSLFGNQESDRKGAGEDAMGDFTAEMDLQKGKICYLLELEGIPDATVAQIHEGQKGDDGPPVVTLDVKDSKGDDVCLDADVEVLKKISKSKGRYYINVHSTAFPDGAVRGQLDE